MSAGSAVRAFRQAMDLGQSDLAAMAGVGRSYLSEVECGHAEPSPRWLHQVTDALGRHLSTG